MPEYCNVDLVYFGSVSALATYPCWGKELRQITVTFDPYLQMPDFLEDGSASVEPNAVSAVPSYFLENNSKNVGKLYSWSRNISKIWRLLKMWDPHWSPGWFQYPSSHGCPMTDDPSRGFPTSKSLAAMGMVCWRVCHIDHQASDGRKQKLHRLWDIVGITIVSGC